MVRPLAYITANWSDNEFEAKSTALRYCRKVYDAGFSPICPRLMYEGLLRDEMCIRDRCLIWRLPIRMIT